MAAAKTLGVRFVLFCAVLTAAGCEPRGMTMTTANGSRLELPRGVEPVQFAAGTVQIHGPGGTHTLRVEIAENDQQRERGLMYRTSMPEDAGMLFVYPAEHQGGFWMFNTFIPLAIAYADGDARIFQITDMPPCESPYGSMCPTYPAERAFRYALETNQGYFARRGIGTGYSITLQRD